MKQYTHPKHRRSKIKMNAKRRSDRVWNIGAVTADKIIPVVHTETVKKGRQHSTNSIIACTCYTKTQYKSTITLGIHTHIQWTNEREQQWEKRQANTDHTTNEAKKWLMTLLCIRWKGELYNYNNKKPHYTNAMLKNMITKAIFFLCFSGRA